MKLLLQCQGPSLIWLASIHTLFLWHSVNTSHRSPPPLILHQPPKNQSLSLPLPSPKSQINSSLHETPRDIHTSTTSIPAPLPYQYHFHTSTTSIPVPLPRVSASSCLSTGQNYTHSYSSRVQEARRRPPVHHTLLLIQSTRSKKKTPCTSHPSV